MWAPLIERAITRRWIPDVPSKIVSIARFGSSMPSR